MGKQWQLPLEKNGEFGADEIISLLWLQLMLQTDGVRYLETAYLTRRERSTLLAWQPLKHKDRKMNILWLYYTICLRCNIRSE
jgi:hypothetical protein